MARQALQGRLSAAGAALLGGARSAETGARRRQPHRHRVFRQKDELEQYLDIAGIAKLVDAPTSADDVEESKPAPDIFEVVLKKLAIEASDAVAIGDSPYDAEAAGEAGISTIGVLCGGFTEGALRGAGCIDVYPGPAALFARFDDTRLAK